MFERKKKNSPKVPEPLPAAASRPVRLTDQELATVQAGKSREIVVVGSKIKEPL